jgi:4-hydroxythreonine-4-phosphate dehydrogenase
MTPRIALVLGDPAGIGAELAVKLLASPQAAEAKLLVIGDRRLFARGAKEAGLSIRLEEIAAPEAFTTRPTHALLHRPLAEDEALTSGRISAAGGRACLENYALALDFAQNRIVDGILFTPFNKQAMRLIDPHYEDEIAFAEQRLGLVGQATEFNIIDAFWNARVTSHVPLRRVADLITLERILNRLHLTAATLRAFGIERPRIAVAALNPHAGDGGAFGREEIEVIAPAVARAQAEGLLAEGPYPADTIFVRAKSGAFHAVLSMYHDQGQIAVKLLGFDHGVTLLAGLPFPIATPAHGTALDIAGQGIAQAGPTLRAFAIVRRLAARP